MTKVRFLVVYDYGQGGVWGFVSARSADEIVARFPALEVVDKPPSWMTDDVIIKLETFDVDAGDPPQWAFG